MVSQQCTAIAKRTDQQCRADALPGQELCFTHSPHVKAEREESRRRGGQAKSNARRAAKQWAAMGAEIPDDALPDVIKALIVSVRAGSVEPAVATCIAGLAKTALQLRSDVELEQRIELLEQAAATGRAPLRRIG